MGTTVSCKHSPTETSIDVAGPGAGLPECAHLTAEGKKPLAPLPRDRDTLEYLDKIFRLGAQMAAAENNLSVLGVSLITPQTDTPALPPQDGSNYLDRCIGQMNNLIHGVAAAAGRVMSLRPPPLRPTPWNRLGTGIHGDGLPDPAGSAAADSGRVGCSVIAELTGRGRKRLGGGRESLHPGREGESRLLPV